jgi:hypothetical protein
MISTALLLGFLQRAEAIRQKQQQAAEEAEAALFAQNPDADYWAPRSSLPPPAGLAKAQQAWAAAAAATDSSVTSQGLHATASQVQVLQLTGSTGTTSSLLGSGKQAGSRLTANMSAGELGAVAKG